MAYECPKCGKRLGLQWWYPWWMRCWCIQNRPLSQLEKVERIHDEDLLLITQDHQSKSVTASQLKQYLRS